MRPPLLAAAVALVALPAAVRADDPDPIKAKLDKAKADYEADLRLYREAVREWLDKQENAARTKSDKAQVDRVKAEREAFDEKGDVPKALPPAARAKAAAARPPLEKAYAAAVGEYTKAKKDAAATAVETEWKAFKAGGEAATGPDAPAGGWTPLFNGKDLSGWQSHPDDKSDWRVVNGQLVGRGPRGHLYSARAEYENFRLRVEAKISDGGNSGVFFRAGMAKDEPTGYEAEINGTPQGKWKTGGLVGFVPAAAKLTTPDRWFTAEVTAVGNRITVAVNGQKASDFVDPKRTYTKGRFAVQQFEGKSVVTFRKIEVMELPPSK